MIRVKARFTNGAPSPFESVDLVEGDEMLVSIGDTHPQSVAVRSIWWIRIGQ